MRLSPQLQQVSDDLHGTAWTYREVAEKAGINKDKFEHLMKNRFDTPENGKEGKDFHLSYTLEWAERVKNNPYKSADEQTEKVLEEAGYQKRQEHQANRMF